MGWMYQQCYVILYDDISYESAFSDVCDYKVYEGDLVFLSRNE